MLVGQFAGLPNANTGLQFQRFGARHVVGLLVDMVPGVAPNQPSPDAALPIRQGIEFLPEVSLNLSMSSEASSMSVPRCLRIAPRERGKMCSFVGLPYPDGQLLCDPEAIL